MKKLFTGYALLLSAGLQAQIGVGTTTPHSTLDVRGSVASAIASFSSSSSAGATDHFLVFTGTSAATLTLPTASGISGRSYWIKNASSNSSVLTIATTSSQTIDGLSSWTLTQLNKAINVISNGTNWYVSSESLPGNSGGTAWIQGGNNVSSQQNLGTTSNHHLPFITNNTEKMRLTSTGSLGIGTSAFNGSYPERLLVDAGASGNTNYQNVIVGKGNTNSYAQLNIQNSSSGTAASADVVATANNGTEAVNFVDMGINGGGNTSTGVLGGANTAYIYATGEDFVIGNSSNNKNLEFYTTTGAGTSTERMRINGAGNVGINTSTFSATNPEALIVDAGTNGGGAYQNVIVGKGNTNSYAQLNIQNGSAGTAASSDVVATANNGNETTNFIDMGINGGSNTSTGVLGGANTAYLYSTGNDFSIGNASNTRHLNFFTTSGGSSAERMRITSAGDIGVGTSTPNYQMHLHKPAASSNWMQITNSATGTGTYDGFFYGVSAAGQPQIWGQGDMAVITGSGTTNNQTLTLTEDGDVGINTSTFNGSNPEQLLVNAGSTGNTNFQNVIVGKGNTNSYAQLNIQNSNAGTAASADVVATANNGSETANFIDMGINSSGNSSAGVLGGSNTAYLYATGNDFVIGNSTNAKDLLFYTTTSSTPTERMRLTSAGHLVPGANNAYNLGSSTMRWATIYSQNVLNVSDARLKTNIRTLNYGLSAVMKMRPVKYNWREGNDETGIGFLAQDLRKIVPEAVVGVEKKETLAVNYVELIPVLVNAIQEQQKQIEELKKMVQALTR